MNIDSKPTVIESIGAILKRRWRLAVGTFALILAASASFIYSLPPIYRATATILIDPGVTGSSAANPQIAEHSQLDSVTEEVLSRARLESIIAQFNLYPRLRTKASGEVVLGRMRKDIDVNRKQREQQAWGQDRTFAITVTYQGWNPQTVAQVTNALVSSYVNESNRLRTRQTSDALVSLRTQMAEIKQKLDAQEQKILAFKNAHAGELPEQQQANLLELQQLNSQLQQNTRDQARFTNGGAASGGEIADSGTATLSQLEQEEIRLRARYTDKYPDVVRIRSQIEALKREQAHRSGGKPVSRTGSEDAALVSMPDSYKVEAARLQKEIALYRQRLKNLPLRQQQLNTLMQGYDETNAVYSSLVKRYEETRLSQAGSVSDSQYRILEPAVPPRDPTGPNQFRLLFMALALCIALTAGLVVLAEQLDMSFHNIDELRNFTRVPVLASIPIISTHDDVIRRRLRLGGFLVLLTIAILVAVQLARIGGQGNELVVWMLSRRT